MAYNFNQLIKKVDDALSPTSTNPVQNKILYNPVNFAESERQKSKNLFDKNSVLRGKEIVSATGGTVNNSGYWVSDYIKIKGMTNLYESGTRTDGRVNCYYDENKNFISTERLENCVGILTPPSNAVYMRFNGKLTELDDVQVEEGTVATGYQPYNGTIVHENDIDKVIYDGDFGNGVNVNLDEGVYDILLTSMGLSENSGVFIALNDDTTASRYINTFLDVYTGTTVVNQGGAGFRVGNTNNEDLSIISARLIFKDGKVFCSFSSHFLLSGTVVVVSGAGRYTETISSIFRLSTLTALASSNIKIVKRRAL